MSAVQQMLVAGRGGDPYYANVSLLLHCDGVNGGTTFTDNSPSPKTVTANGTAQISTAQSKFGGASAYFDGTTNCYAQSNASAAYDLGGGNFTVEFWVYFNSLSGTPHIIQFNGGNVNFRWNLYIGSTIKSLRLYTENGSGTGGDRLSTIDLFTASWYYITVVKNGGDLALYLNGSRMGLTALVSFPSGNLSLTLGTQFFSPVSGDYLNGYIDEVRITKGVARYTANFTPPTAPFPNY